MRLLDVMEVGKCSVVGAADALQVAVTDVVLHAGVR